ncbi:hypothetical protein FH581_003650 [Leptospira weilii]|uniref:hypothetical protein n=1 Tax=Leptospira weilii TaxID=28184 RepID=UPI001EF34E0F|nr:hypothetical protein [Leptospira weilii]ULH30417.1 hypothetical protein FH586_11565 [Leptospira weilii]UPY77975.1 hypothetical protein FH581_003650 [Leptospira weilii]
MITTILISVLFGALVTLITAISKDIYRDYQIPKRIKSALVVLSEEEEDELKREMIEDFVRAPGDLAVKLEGFLESLKFHDQILDRMFQTDMDSEDHIAIGSTFGLLMGRIRDKIKKLRQKD